MYAVVDIETTGSPAKKNGITEIAIVLYDGENITDKYTTLINPRVAIPPYVAMLTGISNDMIATAPLFEEVASEIFKLLNGKIFVAHNAGFDFQYIQYFLNKHGYKYSSKVLCTLSLSRQAFPNLRKHGLEFLCDELKIENKNRHRATGDALATTQLLQMILKNNGEYLVQKMIYNG